MSNDEEEREMVEKALIRMDKRNVPEGAEQPREHGALGGDAVMNAPGASSSSAHPPEAELLPDYELTEPGDDRGEPVDLDEIPQGVAGDFEGDAGLEDLDDLEDLGDLLEEDGEVEGPAGVAHRQESGPTVIEPRVRDEAEEESHEALLAAKQRVAAVGKAIQHVSMKKIISELENDPRLKLKTGNHRHRRTASQAIKRGIV